MFDDCNTFFKGKPDGRDAAWPGVPGTGANATPGTRRAALPSARCAILTFSRFRPSSRPKVSRGPRGRARYFGTISAHRNRLGTARRRLRGNSRRAVSLRHVSEATIERPGYCRAANYLPYLPFSPPRRHGAFIKCAGAAAHPSRMRDLHPRRGPKLAAAFSFQPVRGLQSSLRRRRIKLERTKS